MHQTKHNQHSNSKPITKCQCHSIVKIVLHKLICVLAFIVRRLFFCFFVFYELDTHRTPSGLGSWWSGMSKRTLRRTVLWSPAA